MGIIPAAAQGVVANYAADVLAAPWPVAVATVLAVLTVIGLRILGDREGARKPDGRRMTRPGRPHGRSPELAVAAALLPRLPQRVPQTRALRPASPPDATADRPLRGPPGCDLPSRCAGFGGGTSPR